MTTWMVALSIVRIVDLGGIRSPVDMMMIKLPTRESCEAVRDYLRELNRAQDQQGRPLITEALYVGDCRPVERDD